MMKDDIELRRAAVLKAARSIIRLKHSIRADAELNEVLPAIERDFMAAVQDGFLPDADNILARLLDEGEE